MAVQFINPPPSNYGRGPNKHDATRLELQAHPGEWALILTGASNSVGSHIKRGIGGWGPAGAYEATTRKNGERFDIYVRYVGGAA